MHALPLIIPGTCEAIAADLFDRAALPALQGRTEWNSIWQNASVHYGDVAAWALVAFFLLTLGVFIGCIIALRLRPPGPTREHLLIDEVLRNEDALASGSASREVDDVPWERPADWWKRDGQ